MNIEIKLADVKIRISLCLPDTKKYFSKFITQEECSGWDVRVEDEDIHRYPLICPSGVLDAFSEAYLLIPHVSAFLLKHGCVLIHGVSFVWTAQSWLITAPSGIGKTTQFHHLQSILGDEIELINGDKTILSLNKKGQFWLHPSPWMGKEKECGSISGQLAGIIILEQETVNSISLLSPRESVLQVFQQILVADSSEEELMEAGEMESMLLDTIPVWRLKNCGDIDSAHLMIQTIEEYGKKTKKI